VIKLLTDENFDGDILRGLIRRMPDLDVIRVQDIGLSQTPDHVILAWAAANQRVLLTHDMKTIPDFAYDRVRAGELMPGVFLVNDQMPKGQAIEQLLFAIECLDTEEAKDQVRRFPLR
jgi:predicted nuclease of predicted toxin-antitoxin system